MIEVETQTTEVEIVNNIEVTSTDQVEVETVDLSNLDITVAKKEYVITGDDIYIPMLYDDAPQWMKDLVQVVVDVSISSGNQSLINNMNAILQDFAVSYVPLNQYTQSILDLGDEDTRINALLETLNSNFNNGLSEANAQIISLQMTKASKDEVVAQVIQTIAAQLADGASNIGSTIGRIDQAIADETSARALSLQTLTASLEDTNLDVTANAEVIQNALAYVGIDEAGASTGTGVSAYLEGSNGVIGSADSKVVNNVYVDNNGNSRSKFEYNSSLNIGGNTYNSGFGLSNSSGTGVGSEFWIDASKLKFTNSAKTGSKAPFTIDATGTTPQITFNGKVSFSNINNVPVPSTSIISSNWATGSGSTGIFSMNGLATENYRVYADNHNGERVVVWECRPDSANDGDGGWNTSSFEIDRTKTYRYSVFVKTSANTGQTYLGCGGNTVANLNTTTKNTNPYFWSGVLPTQNEWYLIVGYVYPSGQTGLTNKGGIYSCVDGKKVSTITDFNWASDATTGSHRCYHFYDTVTTTRQWMWNPRVDLIDGNEPSIIDLIGKVDVSSGIASNNDVFAQKLGYANYSAMVAAAASGKTIINGGYINTGLIQANAIVANQINTTGLIAENISANEIVGKTLTGTVINGARINGSVIKASYLDLDGELEVLTNYHISVAMYNASPSLYTDAVYISADNEYRIPSISTISSLEKVVSSSSSPWVAVGSYTLSSGLYSYATANVGHNMKAVKPRPSIINFSESGSSGGLSSNTLYSAVFDGTTSGYFKFSIGNLLILSLTISKTSVSYSGLVGSGSIAATTGGTTTVNLSYCGMSFVVRRGASYGMRITVEYLGNTNMSISSDWTSSQIYVTSNSVLNPSLGNTLIGLRLPAISINNMI